VSLLCSCYYTSRICSYFIDGECYENYTTTTASTCKSQFRDRDGYFASGRCYYRAPLKCSAGQYPLHCTCYPQRSTAYSNATCINIGGYLHNDSYCYYVNFSCRGYAENDQCYSRVKLIQSYYVS